MSPISVFVVLIFLTVAGGCASSRVHKTVKAGSSAVTKKAPVAASPTSQKAKTTAPAPPAPKEVKPKPSLPPPAAPIVSLDIPFLPGCVYTGAYCPDSATREVTEKSISDFEALVEKKVFFAHLIVNWVETNPMGEPSFLPFPSQACEMIRRHGSIPLVTWQTNIEARSPDGAFLLDRIADGEFDGHLKNWTKKIKLYPGLVLLRWGYEMNGDWFSWSGKQNSAEAEGEFLGPQRFCKAWRHIHDLFQTEGVKNVQWVWSVYHTDVFGDDRNAAEVYWPGDTYVDWIGLGAINWSRTNGEGLSKWRSLSDIIENCYQRVKAKLPAKPVFLVEMACANQAAREDGDKADWIKDAFLVLPKKYPRIKAFSWHNDSVQAQPGFYPANFRLDFAPNRKAYAQGIASAFYITEISQKTSKP